MTGPLDEVWTWYEFARDTFRQASRLVETEPDSIHPDFPFSPQAVTREDARRSLRQTVEELDDLAVLALFAVFEQSLVDHLCSACRQAEGRMTSPLNRELVTRGLKGADRWPFADILDAYKTVVDAALVGKVKQVKKYRDWVAHGRRTEPLPGGQMAKVPPADIRPRAAYEWLKEFLDCLQPGSRPPAR